MRFTQNRTGEKFKDFVQFLVEWSGGSGYQRGGTLGQARDSARDERKLSKSEEIELAEQSPIFRKHMSPTGWKFVTTVHAAARAFQRRLEFEFQQWREIHDRVAARCDAFDRWKKGDNFVLFYSKSLQQGYVTNVFPDTKTIRIITILPKAKNLAPAGTAKVLVESAETDFEMYLMEAAEVETILAKDALEEIDKSTLKSYLKKADKSAADHSQKSREAWEKGDKEADDKHFTKAMNREKGKIGANKRLNESKAEGKEVHKLMLNKTLGVLTTKHANGEHHNYTTDDGGNTWTHFRKVGEKRNVELAHEDVIDIVRRKNRMPMGMYESADLNEAAQSMVAPDGMAITKYTGGGGSDVPKVGDWLSYSIHYSMLSGAHAFEIVGFSGTSTILAQEYAFSDGGDDNTRVLKLDKTKKVGTVVKLRVSKRGDVKIGGSYLRFYAKAEVDAKGITYKGSRYD